VLPDPAVPHEDIDALIHARAELVRDAEPYTRMPNPRTWQGSSFYVIVRFHVTPPGDQRTPTDTDTIGFVLGGHLRAGRRRYSGTGWFELRPHGPGPPGKTRRTRPRRTGAAPAYVG
jgi:hypothetical protein